MFFMFSQATRNGIKEKYGSWNNTLVFLNIGNGLLLTVHSNLLHLEFEIMASARGHGIGGKAPRHLA